MKQVNTPQRLREAALTLFAERGYAATRIADIERAAGLAPRAGAFYRHFSGKRQLLEEVALAKITESPAEFDLDGLRTYGDTRAELLAIARQYELAAARQRPYRRLIDELRVLGVSTDLERRASDSMIAALSAWVGSKPGAANWAGRRLAAMTLAIFGAWLFWLGKRETGAAVDSVDDTAMRGTWADYWATVLDTGPGALPANRRE